jgi:hypothetical protein
LFPDLSEFGPEERFKTGIIKPDGTAVEVYSSVNKDTVDRHFQWMRDYRIDGAFVRRFALGLRHSRARSHTLTVLQNARAGAAANGRTYAVMYELMGMEADKIDLLIKDWKDLTQVHGITSDDAYLKHEGKPVVAISGIGYSDRDYSLAECRQLIEFLQAQGCAIMVSVPSDWRSLDSDAIADPTLLDLLATVDIINPTSIGSYETPRAVRDYASTIWRSDKAWCDARGIDYIPAIFPGYSRGSFDEKDQDAVPRQHGKLLWAQFQSAKSVGCQMALVVSFDGMNNGTAILKFDKTATNLPDINGIGFEDIPNDYYLKLTGDGGMLLKNAIARRIGQEKNALKYSISD